MEKGFGVLSYIGIRAKKMEVRVSGLGFRVEILGFRVSGKSKESARS